MRLKNRTGCVQAENFIRQEVKPFETTGLSVCLKYTQDKDSALRGYFRPRDGRIIAAVHPTAALPAMVRFPVRTEASRDGHFQSAYEEEEAATLDELMVWVFFHEFHHFLCHTRQRTGHWQTKANAYGFELLRKFKGTVTSQASWPAPLPAEALKFREPVVGIR